MKKDVVALLAAAAAAYSEAVRGRSRCLVSLERLTY